MTDLTPEHSPTVDGAAASVIPEGILRARAALRRDLPALLADRRARGKWACYSCDGRIAIGTDYTALIRECVNRGIPDAEFVIERVTSRAGSEEEEEIDSSFV